MRARKIGLVSSAVLLALMLECAPALATKPSEPPGKTKVEARKSAKIDARGGQSRQQTSPDRAGFAASDVRSRDDRDDRDDDRHDARDRSDSRNDWRDRDDDQHHDGWDDRHDGSHNDWRGSDNWHRDDRDDRWRHNDDNDWRRDSNRFYSYSRDYDRRDDDRRYYAHDYYRRGYVVPRLPVGYRVVPYYGVPYYFGGGAWYRPYGSNFTVVSPPIGLTVSFLPDVYTTLWAGGIPYYRANDVYYRWQPQRRAYIVTALPIG